MDPLSLLVECMSKCFWDIFIGQAKYTRDLEKNLTSLRELLPQILAEKAEIEYGEMLLGQRRIPIVDAWLTRVAATEIEISKLIQDGPQEIQRLCLCGYCSKSCISSYKFGEKVAQQLNTVKELLATAKEVPFKSLIGHQRPNKVDLIPLEPTTGLDLTFNKAWSSIQDEKVGIIGLYGPGGVGKTTLLKLIHNKFPDTDPEKLVVWIDVSKDCTREKLQEDIGKKIGLSYSSWKNNSYIEKATNISRMLKIKKFVLLLDDVWEHVNLTQMGIPIPSRSNGYGSKIIFTTRSSHVCDQLQANSTIMVDFLAPKEAFKLFCEKVGEDTLNSDPKILELAESVAEACGGLPLALITVALAMTGKRTTDVWVHAVECLKNSPTEFRTLTEKVYPILKFSYDNLPSDKERSCFLYCCLLSDYSNIRTSDLIEYWIYEGFLEGRNEICKRGRGFDIIETLLKSGLLQENDDKSVKMHDVTREMALWIAQEFEKDKHGFFVRSGSMLGKIPRIEEWKDAKKVSLMHYKIEQLQEAQSCSHLSTLLLQRNNLETFNGQFFQCMPSLVILDLSENEKLVKLPSEISKLVYLEYLNVYRTSLEDLASGLHELIRLKYLNVEFTRIKKIPCKLISNFQKLQTLKMDGDSYSVEEEDEVLFEELESLEDLSTLTITIYSNTCFHKFQNSSKLKSCTTGLSLNWIKVIELSILLNMKRLESLRINHCTDKNIVEESDIRKVKEADGGEKLQDSGPSRIFQKRFDKLHSVNITHCHRVVDLTWLICAPNITDITVFNCEALEEIINTEKLGKNEDLNQLFAKLELLMLNFLPSLQSICECGPSFPHLKRLDVQKCPVLKKLPINSSTAKDNKFIIVCVDTSWWEQLEWDESTRTAFSYRCYMQ